MHNITCLGNIEGVKSVDKHIYKKAKEILLNQDIKLATEDMPILDSLDYILAEDIKSDINIPPLTGRPLTVMLLDRRTL